MVIPNTILERISKRPKNSGRIRRESSVHATNIQKYEKSPNSLNNQSYRVANKPQCVWVGHVV